MYIELQNHQGGSDHAASTVCGIRYYQPRFHAALRSLGVLTDFCPESPGDHTHAAGVYCSDPSPVSHAWGG